MMNHQYFSVSQAADGYFQWCAKPPYGDSVYGGFEDKYAAYRDAVKFFKIPPVDEWWFNNAD